MILSASLYAAPAIAQTPAGQDTGSVTRDSLRADSLRRKAGRRRQTLTNIRVEGVAPVVGHVNNLPDVRGTEIYAGKKTEVLHFDSLTVNTALNVTRSVLGRVPGMNVTETENSGFPSNGIGFRGLNPIQSVEMNVRQDGVNIVADLYGYPETYYTPPVEALDRVELIRGASSLQFGPQFGGVVNYILRDGTPNTKPTYEIRQTGGSFDTYNSYASVSGGVNKLTYFAYGQYRGQQGWRENSDVTQLSASGRLGYQANDRVRLGAEYTLLRNRIHMPGGLDNDQFNADSRQSTRTRNWLASPWNIAALTLDADLSKTTRVSSKLSYMFSQRYLVWRNEDGGPSATDEIDPVTNSFAPREVEREYFKNVTNETRLLTTYNLFGRAQSLATGFRVFAGNLHRQEGGPGTTGSDFDMSLTAPYEKDIKFNNTNVSGFVENVFRLSDRFSVTPGVRVEYLHSTARGYTDTAFTPDPQNRTFALAGVGAQYHTTGSTTLYANITQAYRPIEYSYLTPFASLSRIDPNIKDPKGYNADVAWRGNLGQAIDFDLGLFYLAYHDRIGLISGVDSLGTPFTERTNVANSVHKGAETYVDVRPFALFHAPASWGNFGVFDALGYTHARYTTGTYAGNTVEYAPSVVNRAGLSYEKGRLASTAQWSSTSRQFGDANNTTLGYDATVGIIPAYQLVDLSAKYRIMHRTTIGAGVNNLANLHYFTFRTSEYPGPGIIPGIGRAYYVTFSTGL